MPKDKRILPRKIPLPFKIKRPVLALGAQTKNTICFARGKFAYLSLARADLDNPKDFLSFIKDARYFLKQNPRVIAYDLHPQYQSTRFALSLNAKPVLSAGKRYKLCAIQHHHSHAVACLAENSLANQKVIAVAFDGTGLGADQGLWGAEFFILDYQDSRRMAHLKEVALLGGEMAILEPWRLASAWLYGAYKNEFLNLGIDFTKGIDKKKWLVLERMLSTGFNSPLASSMGRLFDAAASLILAKPKAGFEAELAIELEKLAGRPETDLNGYSFRVIKKKGVYIVDPTAVFKEISLSLKHKEPKGQIAYRFHLTIAEITRKICLLLRKSSKINKVVLSGGVFQNKLLLQLTLGLLYKERFKVFTHTGLSCNDSSISLGQALIANFRR
jgi:hydrogenase maturation protein HypF